MRFQLDHDWQSNVSEPKAQLGEETKTRLLLLLCAIWILVGLTGHGPWKPLEIHSISVVKTILDQGNLIAPLDISENTLQNPPFYYWTAALSAKLLSPLLAIHDGARFINALWLSTLLLMVGMCGREMWSQGVGRHATFIMIGTIGLLLTAHSLNNHVATLTAISIGFYAMILIHRRQQRAALLLGLSLILGFLTGGFIPIFIILTPILVLMIMFNNWRTMRNLFVLLFAITLSIPFCGAWLLMFHHFYPALFTTWIEQNTHIFNHDSHFYYLSTLLWFAWPALPLALIGLWRYQKLILTSTKFQFIIVFFTTTWLILGFSTENKDAHALPLLLPLVILGAGSIESLKRGVAAALNWFGVTIFATFGTLIWLGWIGMMTGHPAKIQERMRFLSGAYQIDFDTIGFTAAILMTLVWLIISIRAKLTKRSTVTNWAIGMTFIWSLLMSLWLPMIDHAKSYGLVFQNLESQLPTNYRCINSLNVGRAQTILLHYYTGIQLQPLKETEQLNCDLYLIQDERGVGEMTPGLEWGLIWQGKRPAERREKFRLLKLYD